MEVLWNQINLQRPPYRPWDVPINEFDPKQFTQGIDKILNDFKLFDVLHTEAALLSRLIYRMKSKFRSDKGLKHMEKVNRALLNYLNMSLPSEYELLKEYTEINNGIVSLPPQQTLEYVLVRTQGFAKLMSRVESTAMIAGNFLQSRLHIGQSWTVAMIAYAVVSRIWILSRHIIKSSCVWYGIIYKYYKIFKAVGISWLPENYVLPRNLSHWLDLPWFHEDWEKISLQADWKKSILDFTKINNETETDISIIDNLNDENIENEVEKFVIQQNKLNCVQKVEENDLGKPISRDNFEKVNQKPVEETIVKKEKKKKKNENINQNKQSNLLNIKSEKDLVRLLTTDDFPGLDKLQWNILRKSIKKLLLKLTKKNTCDVDKKICKKVTKYIQKWMSSR